MQLLYCDDMGEAEIFRKKIIFCLYLGVSARNDYERNVLNCTRLIIGYNDHLVVNPRPDGPLDFPPPARGGGGLNSPHVYLGSCAF